MNGNEFGFGRKTRFLLPLLVCVFILPLALFAATQSPKEPVVPKWERFEHEFRSSVVYSNALQDATLVAVFTSPLGETRQ
ncbi:MAG TPA: hypothetical protein VN578_00905, partial [Candidatus Binatia bacterium]|nr:hypothetical protein [Candidatus Binatia bacterium]